MFIHLVTQKLKANHVTGYFTEDLDDPTPEKHDATDTCKEITSPNYPNKLLGGMRKLIRIDATAQNAIITLQVSNHCKI